MHERWFSNSLVLGVVTVACLAGCAGEERDVADDAASDTSAAPDTGTLLFTANGEDFIREGFVSKDGWSLSFDEAWVHVADVAAMQTDPAYDPHGSEPPRVSVEVALENDFAIDLADGPSDADPIVLAAIDNAPAGRYNALSWEVSPAELGVTAPNAILLSGTATKEADTLSFSIGLDLDCLYIGGEYVGDERKGILEPGGVSDVEMTFHFDHIFGDAGLPGDDDLNNLAVGFQPFADLAEDGAVDVRMADLADAMSPEALETLAEGLSTLGHVGEGHCHTVLFPH